MGEGSSFSKFAINAVEDVATVKAAVAAGIPVAVEGSQAAIAALGSSAAVGDSAATQAAIGSLTQYVEQLQSLAASQKAAQEFGTVTPVEPFEKKSK